MRSIRAIVSDIDYLEPAGSIKAYKNGVNPSKYSPGYLVKNSIQENSPTSVIEESPSIIENRTEDLKRQVSELQYPTKRQSKPSASFELIGESNE